MAVNVHTEAPDRVRRLQEPHFGHDTHFGHEPAQPELSGDCEDDADWAEAANADWTCAAYAPGERNARSCTDVDAAGVMAYVACPVACETDCCPPTGPAALPNSYWLSGELSWEGRGASCVWVDPPPPPPPFPTCGRRRLQEEGTTLTVSACCMLPRRLSSEA